jgi:fructokinase
MKRPVVVGIGELLWDVLPDGKTLGGAPANFAYVSHVLGADARVVTCVGRDKDGDEALRRLQGAGLSTEYCHRGDFPTGSAGVQLRDGQPCFTIAENVAWDHIELDDKTLALMRAADAVCFGSLAQRSPVSRHAIQDCVRATSSACLRIFDGNLRQSYYSKDLLTESLRLATIAKMNDAELPIVTKLLECGSTAEDLRTAFDLDLVCVTRGEHGCWLASRETTVDHPGFPTQVVDAIGAGDAFTAAMTFGLLREWKLARVAAFGNSWGAFVASRRGAMPVVTSEEIAEIERQGFNRP